MNKWTSIKDELPKCGERVLVTDGNAVFEAFLSISHKWIRDRIGWLEGMTHWMSLPEPPNEMRSHDWCIVEKDDTNKTFVVECPDCGALFEVDMFIFGLSYNYCPSCGKEKKG